MSGCPWAGRKGIVQFCLLVAIPAAISRVFLYYGWIRLQDARASVNWPVVTEKIVTSNHAAVCRHRAPVHPSDSLLSCAHFHYPQCGVSIGPVTGGLLTSGDNPDGFPDTTGGEGVVDTDGNDVLVAGFELLGNFD